VTDPREEYGKRLEAHERTIAAKERQHLRLGNFKLATIAAGLLLAWVGLARHLFSAWWLILPVVTYIILAILHEAVLRTQKNAETAASYYRTGFARMEDRWSGTGATGDRFRDPNHVYADDLDLFGRGCLFELLCTARMSMGENRLAEWLRSPAPAKTVVERQALVAELRSKLDLREDIAVTGEDLRARLNPESLTKWAEGESTLGGTSLRVIAAACAVIAAAAFGYYFATTNYWPFAVVLIAELILFRNLRARAVALISEVHANAEGIELFSKILERIEREQFASPHLQEFASELKRGPRAASVALRQFAHIVNWIDAADNLFVKVIDRPLLYVVQTGLAADAWRKSYGGRMRAWIDIASEMEALLSLATYSFEHPADPFPEFTDDADSQAIFAAEELGHPLIAAAKCVRNSVRLNSNTRVLLVSGSNMSGKSTLLRTVGINTVLSLAGAPVRAKSLRLSSLSLGTRLRSSDSLQEGRSNFYTEVLRIKQVVDLANSGAPTLFLFDELLDGTNSHDRRIGAESLLRAFLERDAIGMVTTHDLALTEMATSLGAIVHNVHLQDYVENGQMRFDYKLRDGVVAKSNALELMRLAGLKV
jgi:hypothetical protein